MSIKREEIDLRSVDLSEVRSGRGCRWFIPARFCAMIS
jgi:hypothetical protein